MKQLLLTAAATMTCAFMANAESYTVQAQAYEDADYASYGYELLADYAIDIEVNDTYLVLKNWLKIQGEDLRVEFNEDGDITAFIPVVNGVDGTPDLTQGNELVGIDTSNPDFNYFFLYPGYSSVSIDPEDEDGCYVFIYGAGYDADWDEINGYFDWEWTVGDAPADKELWYTVESKATEDEEWSESFDGCFAPDKTVTINVYDDNSVLIKGWTGNDADQLLVNFDDEENVTSIKLLNADGVVTSEAFEYESSTYVQGTIGNDEYYYVQFYLSEGYDYAYANAEEGYVTLSGYFYKDEETYAWLYYNIAWPYEETGIADINTVDGAAVYYNLNGIRVDNPSVPGLYIKRQGDKAVKVAIR